MRIPALALTSLLCLCSAATAEEKDFKFFSFGPGAILNQDAHGVAYHLAGGYFHEAMSSAGIRVMGSGDFTSDALNVSGALGALGFLGKGEFAPYAGADLGWGVAYGNGWSNGFILGGSVGVQMFRSSKVQLNLEGRSTVMFAENDGGFPVTLAGALGISF